MSLGLPAWLKALHVPFKYGTVISIRYPTNRHQAKYWRCASNEMMCLARQNHEWKVYTEEKQGLTTTKVHSRKVFGLSHLSILKWNLNWIKCGKMQSDTSVPIRQPSRHIYKKKKRFKLRLFLFSLPFIFYCIEVKVASTLPNENSGQANKTKQNKKKPSSSPSIYIFNSKVKFSENFSPNEKFS